MSNNQLSPSLSRKFSTGKKLSETEESQTIKSRFSQLPVLDISMFSTNYTLKRVNQIKPKPKIIIPQKIQAKTVVSDKTQSQIQQNKPKKESLSYSSVKSSVFSWRKFPPLCGFQVKTGQNGCLCGNPCPLQAKWSTHYKQSDFILYQNLLNQQVPQSAQIQIQKDLPRTHPQCPTFSANTHYQEMLRQVLTQYAVYDPQVGYVQGMNLIVGTILYHMKNSELTFWAFVDLMDEQQLRLIYLEGFRQLTVHVKIILDIMDRKVNDLLMKMHQINIIPESFLNGWILSLMGNCVPLEYMHLLIHKFRSNGWNFIYQLIITYLLFMKESLMRAQDESEFLENMNTKDSRQYGAIWEQLIKSAQNFPIHNHSSKQIRHLRPK